MSGEAHVKSEYIIGKSSNQNCKDDSSLTLTPAPKKLKTDRDTDCDGDIQMTSIDEANSHDQLPSSGHVNSVDINSKKEWRKQRRGRNKDRPMRTGKLEKYERLCQKYLDGFESDPCKDGNSCLFIHDVKKYLELPATMNSKVDKECYIFKTYGKCYRGLTCLFSKSHTDDENHSIVNIPLWNEMKSLFDSTHGNILDRETQQQLRSRKFDFEPIEKICKEVERDISRSRQLSESKVNENYGIRTSGPITDENEIPIRKEEIKRIDWNNKLYLSPLTTVGNLPFRRICVDFGADITCGEMSLANAIVSGAPHEFALHRRHPSEKIWGIQLCSNNATVAAKACHILDNVGVEFDFVDLNMGCPLDNIYCMGAGSGLMPRTNKVETMAKTMSAVLESKHRPFTVKMRAGVKTDKYIAHDLIKLCKNSGVSAVTLHGRTREQRYTKSSNWDYIGECVKIASPMSLFGNGDVLSWEEYVEKKKLTDVAGVMIGRGALMKPWVFQEIKEERPIDMSSTQRLEVIQRFCNYGLDHWGSDFQGVETCRRFLLEWLSFYYRYIPQGILESPPQRMNQRPPKYVGRDDMETLLASSNCNDWVKISEMFLGPVPDNFVFLPKHKANSWS